jgi:hypothetical protein
MLEENAEEIHDMCTGCRRLCERRIGWTRWVIFRQQRTREGRFGVEGGYMERCLEVTFREGLLGGLKAKIKINHKDKVKVKVKVKVGAKDVHAGRQIHDATGVCLAWWYTLMLIGRWGCGVGCSCRSDGGYPKGMILLLMAGRMGRWPIDGVVFEWATDAHGRR